jgi:hypothetical protein
MRIRRGATGVYRRRNYNICVRGALFLNTIFSLPFYTDKLTGNYATFIRAQNAESRSNCRAVPKDIIVY